MKKQTNIAALKKLVNNNVLDRVKLRVNGVQAYNIAEGEEYTVIVKYAKQRGRYYFVDRDGRRFLASHYDLVKDDEPAQQEDNNDESDNNNTQSNDSNEGDQTDASPSRLAKVAAKVKTYARRTAFAVSLAAVAVLCFCFFCACFPALHMMLQAAGIEGTACTVFTWCALVPALDITSWLECNALAVLARLFPGSFVGCSRPEFLRPCSIIAKMYRNAL